MKTTNNLRRRSFIIIYLQVLMSSLKTDFAIVGANNFLIPILEVQ